MLYVYLAGRMESESAGGSRYVMMIVDNYSGFNVTSRLTETEMVLERYIVTYITPEHHSIRAFCTDHGGEFKGAFEQTLGQLGRQHQHSPSMSA